MNKFAFYSSIISFLICTSCSDTKTYIYVEILEQEEFSGQIITVEKPGEIIKASSDSAAFLIAFEKFLFSNKLYEEFTEAYGSLYRKAIEFKLIDKNGNDIADSTEFIDKERLLEKLTTKIASKILIEKDTNYLNLLRTSSSSSGTGSATSSNRRSRSGAWLNEDNSTMAYIMVKDWVLERLISPSTAKFPSDTRNHSVKISGQKYRVSSYVDAQNRFGATIRINFVGIVEEIDEGKWQLISLDLSER